MLLLHPSSPYHYLILTSRRAIITMWLKNENIVTFASCRPHGAVIDTTSLLDALVLAFAYLCHASQGNTIIVWLETENTMMRDTPPASTLPRLGSYNTRPIVNKFVLAREEFLISRSEIFFRARNGNADR
jgi:hypothetical protein